MDRHTLQAAVDSHTCTVDGTLYRFRLEWTAVEPTVLREPRRLMQVEVRAMTGRGHPPAIMHLLVQLHRPQELYSLLEDALCLRLKAEHGDGEHVAAARDGAS